MNVIGIQWDIAWENKQANFEKVRSLLKEAAPEKNSLVVLPEMFATGFSMNAEKIAEGAGQETEQFLSNTAKEFKVCLLGGAAMRGRDGRARNKALVFSPSGELLGFYAKMQPFVPGGEAEHYTAGEKVAAFRWADFIISPFICYDIRFPEIFREAAAKQRPELFVIIASFPDKRISHWQPLLKARAIENQAYVVGVNRIGKDPYHAYNGQSAIFGPHGELMADAGDREGCIRAELDLAGLRKYREALPFLGDMRSLG